jgi:hypothetical protein
MTTPQDVIKLASSYATAHYKEDARNDNVFGKWYGVNNIPWCAIFVSYVFNKTGAGALVAAGNPKGFASCTVAVRWFENHNRIVKAKDAQPGDIVFMCFNGTGAFDHVGICISNDPKNKVLHTVEGNTVNPNGTGDQVNGDGTYFKTRPYGYITAVANPNWAALTK